MNRWGCAGCREHRQEIIDHLWQAAYKTWVNDQIKIGWELCQQPWFRITDPVGSIVDEAIRRAESDTMSQTDMLK